MGMGRLGEPAPKLPIWELPGLVGDRASRGSKSPGKLGTFLSHERKAAGGQQFCLPRLEPGPSPTPSRPPPLLGVCAPTLSPPTVPWPIWGAFVSPCSAPPPFQVHLLSRLSLSSPFSSVQTEPPAVFLVCLKPGFCVLHAILAAQPPLLLFSPPSILCVQEECSRCLVYVPLFKPPVARHSLKTEANISPLGLERNYQSGSANLQDSVPCCLTPTLCLAPRFQANRPLGLCLGCSSWCPLVFLFVCEC